MGLLLLSLLAFCSLSCGLIVQYDELFPGSSLDWFLVGLYKSQATLPPGVFSLGVGASFIDLNLSVTRPESSSSSGHVEALIFREDQLAYIGANVAYQPYICCDAEVKKNGGCSEDMMGYVALSTPVRTRKDIFYKLLYFDDSQPVARLEARFNVPVDGLYYIIFVNCNEKGIGAAHVNGTVAWLNIPGFLAGADLQLAMFQSAMSGLYAFVLSAWILVLWWRWDRMIFIHLLLVGILVLGCLSELSRAVHLLSMNGSGTVCWSCAIVSVVFDTFHSLGLRMFALFVAAGLTINVPWWETERRQRIIVGLLALAYVVAVGGQNAMTVLNQVGDNSGRRPVLMILPVNLANTAFIIYIFVELIRSIHHTRDEGDREKFKLYVSHILFLFALACAGMVFYIVQLLGQWRDVLDITWPFEWMINTAAWDGAMLLIVVFLLWLWFPCEEIKALVYHERAPLEWRPARPANNVVA